MAVSFREWQGQYSQHLLGKSEAECYQLFLEYAPDSPVKIEPMAQVSTSGDLVVGTQTVEPEPYWKSQGFESYEDYVEDFKARAHVTPLVKEIEIREALHLPDPFVPAPEGIEFIEEVHEIGITQVNPLDPEFPAANLIEVSPGNYAQAFYQITEGGSRYPISDVSGEGGIVTVTSPEVKDMPWGAVIERWRHTLKQTWGIDPLYVIGGVIAIVAVIIFAGIARR